MTKAGKRLIEAMREAIAIVGGEADESTYRIHFPNEAEREKWGKRRR